MQTIVRPATYDDTERIMEIIASAQQALAELSIDQWQDGYPTLASIEEDIERGVGYAACIDSEVVGYAAIVLTGEDAYRQIDKWATCDNYVVVHRLCCAKEHRRSGIAMKLMRFAADRARKEGYNAFRIDTHKGNIRMLAMLRKLGFESRGVVHYDSGERIAFDLNLDLTNMI